MAKSARNQPNFEKAVAELEEIVRQMETGELGLEQALEQYQRGVALVRQCRHALDDAEQRIQRLHEGTMIDHPTADTTDDGA